MWISHLVLQSITIIPFSNCSYHTVACMFYIYVCRESVQRLGEGDCEGCIMMEEKDDDDDCVLVKVELGIQL